MLHPLKAGKVLIPTAFGALRHIPKLPGKLASGVLGSLTPGSGSMFAPSTRFNGAATPHRVFDARFHDLADFKTIKACVPKATINDVALAYVGGALRLYLDGHDELPDETLVAACPSSIRSGSESGMAAIDCSAGSIHWEPRAPTLLSGWVRSWRRPPPSAMPPIPPATPG